MDVKKSKQIGPLGQKSYLDLDPVPSNFGEAAWLLAKAHLQTHLGKGTYELALKENWRNSLTDDAAAQVEAALTKLQCGFETLVQHLQLLPADSEKIASASLLDMMTSYRTLSLYGFVLETESREKPKTIKSKIKIAKERTATDKGAVILRVIHEKRWTQTFITNNLKPNSITIAQLKAFNDALMEAKLIKKPMVKTSIGRILTSIMTKQKA